MADETDEKIRERKEREREAARRCRRKKKEKYTLLEGDVQRLQEENRALRSRLHLKQIVGHMEAKFQLIDHLQSQLQRNASEDEVNTTLAKIKNVRQQTLSCVSRHTKDLQDILDPVRDAETMMWLLGLCLYVNDADVSYGPDDPKVEPMSPIRPGTTLEQAKIIGESLERELGLTPEQGITLKLFVVQNLRWIQYWKSLLQKIAELTQQLDILIQWREKDATYWEQKVEKAVGVLDPSQRARLLIYWMSRREAIREVVKLPDAWSFLDKRVKPEDRFNLPTESRPSAPPQATEQKSATSSTATYPVASRADSYPTASTLPSTASVVSPQYETSQQVLGNSPPKLGGIQPTFFDRTPPMFPPVDTSLIDSPFVLPTTYSEIARVVEGLDALASPPSDQTSASVSESEHDIPANLISPMLISGRFFNKQADLSHPNLPQDHVPPDTKANHHAPDFLAPPPAKRSASPKVPTKIEVPSPPNTEPTILPEVPPSSIAGALPTSSLQQLIELAVAREMSKRFPTETFPVAAPPGMSPTLMSIGRSRTAQPPPPNEVTTPQYEVTSPPYWGDSTGSRMPIGGLGFPNFTTAAFVGSMFPPVLDSQRQPSMYWNPQPKQAPNILDRVDGSALEGGIFFPDLYDPSLPH
mmetsp:Transcript_24373/g.40056  ORF Transcript_24373/g.40056 Transcript_24373/m.40056 type:complete len:642 (-) Transcript_24373:687-2612(-)